MFSIVVLVTVRSNFILECVDWAFISIRALSRITSRTVLYASGFGKFSILNILRYPHITILRLHSARTAYFSFQVSRALWGAISKIDRNLACWSHHYFFGCIGYNSAGSTCSSSVHFTETPYCELELTVGITHGRSVPRHCSYREGEL